MRAAEIVDGKVFNIIEVELLDFKPGLVEVGSARIGDLYVDGAFVTPEPPPPTIEEYQAEVQRHLDAAARAKNYDDIVSACSYAGAPNPFQAEGQKFLEWRGNVWAACYQIMADVQAGTRQPPTLDSLIAELPALQP